MRACSGDGISAYLSVGNASLSVDRLGLGLRRHSRSRRRGQVSQLKLVGLRAIPVAGGVARLLLLNMGQTVAWQHVSLRLVTVGIAAAVLYIFSRRKTVGTFPSERSLNYTNSHAGLFSRLAEPSVMYTASATLLAGLLILQEASSSFVALAWGLLGVAVLEAAMAFADRSLLFQGRLCCWSA